MSNYTNVLKNLEELKLDKMRSELPEYLERIKKEPPHLVDSLYELTKKEIEHKTQQASEALIRTAAFPFKKTLEEFDFDFQPSINKDEIYTFHFLWIFILTFTRNTMIINFKKN